MDRNTYNNYGILKNGGDTFGKDNGGNKPSIKGEGKNIWCKTQLFLYWLHHCFGTEDIILEDVPNLKDIEVMCEVLTSLGAKVEKLDKGIIKINSSNINNYITRYELMSKMRASFLVMGPLLTRLGKTKTSLPGGCAIGTRPIDLHLKGFKALGATINSDHGNISAYADKLVGDKIYLDFPSVGATENIIMAAVLAEGETIIDNAAMEPEIVDLASFLNKLGADIKGAGTSTIRVKGVKKLGWWSSFHHT